MAFIAICVGLLLSKEQHFNQKLFESEVVEFATTLVIILSQGVELIFILIADEF